MDINLGKLWEMVMDREWGPKELNMTWWLNSNAFSNYQMYYWLGKMRRSVVLIYINK